MNSITRLTSLNYNTTMTIERLIARGTQQEPSQCTKLQCQGPFLNRFFRGQMAWLEGSLAQVGRMRQCFWGTKLWYGFLIALQ